MRLMQDLGLLLRVTRTHSLIRRYFVVNGFDGALTMLGLAMGFFVGGEPSPAVMLAACVGATVALFMSGLTSAFISEWEERKRALSLLETAMVADLSDSVHAEAARLVPVVVALVNGLAPVTAALLILIPLMLASAGVDLPLAPASATILMAFLVIFLLGVFSGAVGGSFWLWSGLRSALIAAATAAIILLLNL